MARVESRSFSGTDYTDKIDLKNETILRLCMPSEWTAADLWVEEQVSERDGRWRVLTDRFGDRIAFSVQAGQSLIIDPTVFVHLDRVRFQSSQEQTSPRTIDFYIGKLSELISTSVA